MTERFTLLSELGRGGMGVVWKARDEESGQIVALKLLRETYAEDPDYVTRFEHELELAKRIHSRNVIGVLGYGVRDGTPYLALEFVDGPSLRQRLTSHGPYSWPESKALLVQIAQGLADAHAAGVVHRDLKPSNVLIGSDGVAKLADFGIAKGLDLTRVTGTSTLLGTPAYLPPEGPADERSDLYSLGVIAYELLTGAVPFEGRTYQEVILRHVREAPDLEKLPKEARKTVGWLLAKNPAKRPQSAAELVTALDGKRKVAIVAAAGPAVAGTEPTSIISPAPGLQETTAPVIRPPRTRRRRTTLAIGAFVALILTFASGVTLLAVLPARASPAPSSGPSDVAGQNVTASPGSSVSLGTADGRSAGSSDIAGQNVTPSPGSTASLGSSLVPTLRSTPTLTGPAAPEPTAVPTVRPAPTPQPTKAGAYVIGVVTASEGGPLAGITVAVCLVGGGSACSFSTSRSDGGYAVGPVTPGLYLEQLHDPSGRRAEGSYTPAGLRVWSTYSASIEFDVGSSGVSGIDIALPLGYRVSGTLTAALGKSPNALPCLCESKGQDCTGGWELAGGGTYSTPPVPAGVYVVKIYNFDTGDYVYWSSSGLVAGIGSATPITITSSSISGIDGQLPW